MRPGAAISILIAIVASLTACGDGDQNGPTAKDTITYERSGGIDGTNQLLEIRPDGTATITTGQDPATDPSAATKDFNLPPGELVNLREHLSGYDLDDLNFGVEDTCSDCFVYVLGWGGETATMSVFEEPEEFREAAAPLEEIYDREAPGESPVGGG